MQLLEPHPAKKEGMPIESHTGESLFNTGITHRLCNTKGVESLHLFSIHQCDLKGSFLIDPNMLIISKGNSTLKFRVEAAQEEVPFMPPWPARI